MSRALQLFWKLYFPHPAKQHIKLVTFSCINEFCNLKVVRCCLEHAASVAKTFLTSDAVVTEIPEPELAPAANPMDNSGMFLFRYR